MLAGYYKGYKYPPETPHWTTILKHLIQKTGFKGTWNEAIKKIWKPIKNDEKIKQKLRQNTKPKEVKEVKKVKESKKALNLPYPINYDEIQKFMTSPENKVFRMLPKSHTFNCDAVLLMLSISNKENVEVIFPNMLKMDIYKKVIPSSQKGGKGKAIYATELFIPENLIENIKKSTKRFILLALGLQNYGDREGHQNILIVDNKDKKIKRYDPHGAMGSYNAKSVDETIEQLADELDYEYENMVLNIYYFGEDKILKQAEKDEALYKINGLTKKINDGFLTGLQSLEFMRDLKFSDEYNYLKEDGLCQVYSGLWTELVLLNPSLSIDSIFERFLKQFNYSLIKMKQYIHYYALKTTLRLRSQLEQSKNKEEAFEKLGIKNYKNINPNYLLFNDEIDFNIFKTNKPKVTTVQNGKLTW